MGNAGSSGGSDLPPPQPHLHAGVPPPYYHRYPPCPPGAAEPPPVPFPTQVERHRPVAVKTGVNVKGETLRLERDGDGCHRLAFSFDADAPGRITVYFFAQETSDGFLKGTKENLLEPVIVNFKEGHGQEFKQSEGTGIKLSMFKESELTEVGKDGVFPLVFKVEVRASGNQELEREHAAEHSKCLANYAVFVKKKDNAEYGIHVVHHIMWVNGTRYVLQEIYGIGDRNTADRNVNEDDSVKDCVICLTEPRNTTVLPCRHMCLCRGCAQRLRLQSKKCPICRQLVESLLEIELDSIPNPHQAE